MKTLRFVGMALFVACLSVGLIACSDDNKDTPEPVPEDAFINESGSNNYFTNGMNFTAIASELTFAFDTNTNWSISVANTANGTRWCHVSTTSGGAGHHEVIVQVDENTNYDDRNVTLTIQAGSTKKTIIVTQKQKDAILLTSNKFEVNKTGGKINVEVKSNINYTIEIAETAKNWIKKSNTDTRALSTNTLTFEISPSEEYNKREGEINFKSGEIIETVHVYQTGEGIILLTKDEYTVSDKGETITVELKSNCDFEVKMSNVNWIKNVPETKAMSSHTLYYVISANETYESRETEIIFYDKNNTNIADTLTVMQEQKKGNTLIKKITADYGDGDLEIETFKYDAADRIVEYVFYDDHCRETRSYSYSTNTIIASINYTDQMYPEDSEQYTTTYSLSENKIILEETKGHKLTHAYDEDKHLIETASSSGYKCNLTWKNGNIASTKENNSGTFTYTYTEYKSSQFINLNVMLPTDIYDSGLLSHYYGNMPANLISQEFYDGKLKRSYQYEFDNEGKPTKVIANGGEFTVTIEY